ncbi:MAG: iron ABC transporter permease [Lachnospiraceae bacterium]|nr:iron ABC transporter permease [Lachnospiraceae bacterium]
MKNWQTCLHKIRSVSTTSVFVTGGILLVLMIVLSLCLGAVNLSLSELLTFPPILRYVRIPRVIAAIFAGAGLAGAGVIIQTLLGNSLAGPNIIGVNSGAGFLALIAGILFPLLPGLQPLAAFVGALIAVTFVYLLSKRAGTSKMTIILSGVILNSLFNAASEALCTFFPDINTSYAAFRVGGLSSIQTSVLYPAALIILLAIGIVQAKSNTLELLSLGDDTAFTLGVSVKKYRLMFLVCAAGMAGAAVSFAGLIGFLGLIVPHGARLVVGDEIKKLFPLSVLWGSLLMLVCDTVARTAFAPFELSVGIVLSIIGAPIFIHMLIKRKVR